MEEKSSLYLARFNQLLHECDNAYHTAAMGLELRPAAGRWDKSICVTPDCCRDFTFCKTITDVLSICEAS